MKKYKYVRIAKTIGHYYQVIREDDTVLCIIDSELKTIKPCCKYINYLELRNIADFMEGL